MQYCVRGAPKEGENSDEVPASDTPKEQTTEERLNSILKTFKAILAVRSTDSNSQTPVGNEFSDQ